MKFGLVSCNNPCCCQGKLGYFFWRNTKRVCQHHKKQQVIQYQQVTAEFQRSTVWFRSWSKTFLIMYTYPESQPPYEKWCFLLDHDKPSTYKKWWNSFSPTGLKNGGNPRTSRAYEHFFQLGYIEKFLVVSPEWFARVTDLWFLTTPHDLDVPLEVSRSMVRSRISGLISPRSFLHHLYVSIGYFISFYSKMPLIRSPAWSFC